MWACFDGWAVTRGVYAGARRWPVRVYACGSSGGPSLAERGGAPTPDRASGVTGVASRPVEGVPLFSVVMPVHDKVRHVEAAVRSVLDQSFGDLELIVVDDASRDGSREVVAGIDDPRLRMSYRDTPGPGGYAARNAGVELARGAWITFLDADDTWVEDRLERLWAMIRAFPDLHVHACAWSVAARDGARRTNKYARRHGGRGPHVVPLPAYLAALRRNEPVVHTDTVAIRRTALPDTRVFPADLGLRRGGDVHAWLRLMCRERRLAWSPHAGANYFVDSDNMVTRRVPSVGDFLAPALLAPLEVGMSPEERRRLRRAANGMLWSSWLGNAVQGSPGFALAPRLFWRGAVAQASGMALASLVPPAWYRSARRLVRLSSRGG